MHVECRKIGSLRLGRLLIDLLIIVTPFNLIPVLIGNIDQLQIKIRAPKIDIPCFIKTYERFKKKKRFVTRRLAKVNKWS
jgi:hypothetical protein